jgi:uncharacterized membrane protein (DUF106 family)
VVDDTRNKEGIMAVTGIIDKVLQILMWIFNPTAMKERKLNELRAKLAQVEDEREKARQANDNALYMQKEQERNEILKEIARISGNK